jgi:hypothetical protein
LDWKSFQLQIQQISTIKLSWDSFPGLNEDEILRRVENYEFRHPIIYNKVEIERTRRLQFMYSTLKTSRSSKVY